MQRARKNLTEHFSRKLWEKERHERNYEWQDIQEGLQPKTHLDSRLWLTGEERDTVGYMESGSKDSYLSVT